MLTVCMIVLALLILLFAAGMFLLKYTCGRPKEYDYWDPEVLQSRGYESILEANARGRAWFESVPHEETTIRSKEGLRLKGYFVPCENARGTLLLMHGWHSSWKMDFAIALPFYHSLGLNLMIIEQRSQNGSEGKYMTYGVREREDCALWVKALADRLGKDSPIILGGLSMGAATVLMASDLEFEGNVKGIIADCGFTSPYAILKHVSGRGGKLPTGPVTSFLGIFTRLFAGFGVKECSTVDSLRRTKLPVLLIHGLADDFVPPEMSEESFEAAAGEKELILVEGAKHGMSYCVDQPRVEAAIAGFVEKYI